MTPDEKIKILEKKAAIDFLKWAIESGEISGDWDGHAGLLYANETYDSLYEKYLKQRL